MEPDNFWFHSWPSTVIYCRTSVNLPEAHQSRAAEQLRTVWHALDGGHYPMLSHPDELTALLQASVLEHQERSVFPRLRKGGMRGRFWEE
jgi:pimeloyl-ACP methyl ester carboxylesterase